MFIGHVNPKIPPPTVVGVDAAVDLYPTYRFKPIAANDNAPKEQVDKRDKKKNQSLYLC